MDQQAKVPSGLNILFSLWLIISPFVLAYSGLSMLAMWDAIIVGVIVLILAAIRMANPESSPWLSWINALLGIWLIISPFALGTSHIMAAMWDDVIVGIAFLVFGAWSALATHRPAAV